MARHRRTGRTPPAVHLPPQRRGRHRKQHDRTVAHRVTVLAVLAVIFGVLGTAGASGRNPKPATQEPTRVVAGVGGDATALEVRPAPPVLLPSPRPKKSPLKAKAKPKRATHKASSDRRTEVKKTRASDRADRKVRRTPPPAPSPPPAPEWVRPGTGYLSSGFGSRWGTVHWGIDLAAPLGSPIYAAGDGVVLRAGPSSGFGLAVYIEHENGDVTVYGHEYEVLVSAGQHVEAGQLIAHVGSEGYSTGPHLHFGVYQGGLEGPRIDPIPWLAERGVRI